MSSRVDTELETLIRARYPIVYVVSSEEKRVEDALRSIARERGKKLHVWTITQGFAAATSQRDNTTRDALAALDYVMRSPDQAIFLLKDFHAFIGDYNVTRRLRDLTLALKNSFKNLLILSPILKLPAELEKEITVLDYGLPSYEDLGKLLDDIIRSVRDQPTVDTDLTPEEREQVLKAAQGLTAMEAENVFARSLVEKRAFDVDVILSEKEQIIRKSGILEYYPANEAFRDVGGLDLLKNWLDKRTASFSEKAREFGLPEPRGILLLGVQGCGKSLSAKAIGAQWRLPLLRLDVGKIFAGIVGSSEENMRRAIRVAESVAPCVAGDTRITLADGSEKIIQELYEGEEQELQVLAMTDDWRIVPTPVQAITRRSAPDLYTIRLKHSCLQATSNHLHPVLRNGELHWVRTDKLRPGDHVAMPARISTAAGFPDMMALLPPEMRAWAVARGQDTTEVEEIQALVNSPIAWSKVVAVEAADTPEFVYDLMCAGPHNFIGNDIFSHNCVLWLDELEKGFSGTASSGQTDGGTTSRVFSTFLTWLQEKTAPVFVVSTANQVEALPPELLRKGRFDEIFFIDLPSKEERTDILKIHIRKRKRDPEKFDLKAVAEATPGFSGAELEQLVIEALYDAFDAGRDLMTQDLVKAARASVPLSMTMREKIAYLRGWAETRARKASSAPVESIEEQIATFLHARAEAAQAEELERARAEAEARSKKDGASAAASKTKPRRAAGKREGEQAKD